ncbi:SUMO1 sentrin specific peptidase 8 [Homalodisca vitripennis]|nr:SUMO1 sentrin specific peptidase 8 [Homalodisca vitripennis]
MENDSFNVEVEAGYVSLKENETINQEMFDLKQNKIHFQTHIEEVKELEDNLSTMRGKSYKLIEEFCNKMRIMQDTIRKDNDYKSNLINHLESDKLKNETLLNKQEQQIEQLKEQLKMSKNKLTEERDKYQSLKLEYDKLKDFEGNCKVFPRKKVISNFAVPTANRYEILYGLTENEDEDSKYESSISNSYSKKLIDKLFYSRLSEIPKKGINYRNKKRSLSWYQLTDSDIKLWIDNLPALPKNAVILYPCVSHIIRSEIDFNLVTNLCDDMHLRNTAYVIAVVNNRVNEKKENGCHWSLMVYDRSTSTGYHLDSMVDLNHAAAAHLVKQLTKYYTGQTDCNIVELKCRQQKRKFECGVHVLHNLKIVCSSLVTELPIFNCDLYLRYFSINNYYRQIELLRQSNHNPNSIPHVKKIGNNINSSNEPVNDGNILQVSANKTVNNSKQNNKHGVNTYSGSRSKHLHNLLTHQLPSNCDTFVHIKPDDNANQVLLSATGTIKDLTKNDVIIIAENSNISDVTFKNQKPADELHETYSKFAEKNDNTNNVFVVSQLRHHDVQNYHLPNYEVHNANEKQGQSKIFSLVDINNFRTLFTDQSLYLNKLGKKIVNKRIPTAVKAFLNRDHQQTESMKNCGSLSGNKGLEAENQAISIEVKSTTKVIHDVQRNYGGTVLEKGVSDGSVNEDDSLNSESVSARIHLNRNDCKKHSVQFPSIVNSNMNAKNIFVNFFKRRKSSVF